MCPPAGHSPREETLTVFCAFSCTFWPFPTCSTPRGHKSRRATSATATLCACLATLQLVRHHGWEHPLKRRSFSLRRAKDEPVRDSHLLPPHSRWRTNIYPTSRPSTKRGGRKHRPGPSNFYYVPNGGAGEAKPKKSEEVPKTDQSGEMGHERQAATPGEI